MTITVQLPRSRRAAAIRQCQVFGVGLAFGVGLVKMPYLTPGDPPCRPGKSPLWPGGQSLPAWCELEMGLLSTACGDCLPPTPEQLACLAEMRRTRIPTTRAAARELIRRTLGGETDDRWWETA